MFTALVVSACQTTPKNYESVEQGTWQTKVLVQDKVKKKSFIVNVEFKAQAHRGLRMDVFSPLGTHEASLVLNGDKVDYILVDQRQAFSGLATDQSLKPVISVPVHPKVLESVLFDHPIEKSGWTCDRDPEGFLNECRNGESNLVVRWRDRMAHRKNIFIDHPAAEVQIRVLEFDSKIENPKKAFSLSVPSSFKRHKIN
ncbi:MAG: hypothetical protein H6626_10585 [Pseudobdellovibrionaceae bacterium]|nr:hypothetical protein [Bdellovibrionales bacterium]USN46653.1 MAG: hypothetical protein H6626_10585 [Pseudobdellovibrionaceae bacterium]